MKMGMIKDVDWKYLGALLAQSDDNEQADFLKSFLKECKTWGTHYQMEMQFVSINALLTEEEKESLSAISLCKE